VYVCKTGVPDNLLPKKLFPNKNTLKNPQIDIKKMPAIWYNGIVRDIEPAAPNVRRFRLEVPEAGTFDFKAGQFITLDLPIGEKRLQRWRSYSIANAPDGSNALELCIVRSADGDGTKYMFETVEPGVALRFKGPDGAFVLPETIDKDLVFVCTGTGVAPFRSMIQHLRASGRPHRNLHLIFGTREEAGILYREEFETLTKTLPGFRYDIVLSRQPDWAGHRGYVHQVYLEQYKDARPDVAFYLCGWSNMIDEAVANLLVKLGYARSQIHYELYG
jgi:ferredoxin-NADP reductase